MPSRLGSTVGSSKLEKGLGINVGPLEWSPRVGDVGHSSGRNGTSLLRIDSKSVKTVSKLEKFNKISSPGQDSPKGLSK